MPKTRATEETITGEPVTLVHVCEYDICQPDAVRTGEEGKEKRLGLRTLVLIGLQGP